MDLILDAGTFIWLAGAPDQLSKVVQARIDDPKTYLLLSEVTVLEICLKWTAGKIQLPRPPRAWVAEVVDTWAIEQFPLTPDDLYRTTELPSHHRDPFDRLLIAQAISKGATIATPDKVFPSYPVSVLW